MPFDSDLPYPRSSCGSRPYLRAWTCKHACCHGFHRIEDDRASCSKESQELSKVGPLSPHAPTSTRGSTYRKRLEKLLPLSGRSPLLPPLGRGQSRTGEYLLAPPGWWKQEGGRMSLPSTFSFPACPSREVFLHREPDRLGRDDYVQGLKDARCAFGKHVPRAVRLTRKAPRADREPLRVSNALEQARWCAIVPEAKGGGKTRTEPRPFRRRRVFFVFDLTRKEEEVEPCSLLPCERKGRERIVLLT